jgi:hypothetical protein
MSVGVRTVNPSQQPIKLRARIAEGVALPQMWPLIGADLRRAFSNPN